MSCPGTFLLLVGFYSKHAAVYMQAIKSSDVCQVPDALYCQLLYSTIKWSGVLRGLLRYKLNRMKESPLSSL